MQILASPNPGKNYCKKVWLEASYDRVEETNDLKSVKVPELKTV